VCKKWLGNAVDAEVIRVVADHEFYQRKPGLEKIWFYPVQSSGSFDNKYTIQENRYSNTDKSLFSENGERLQV
jgi:hypothetical protein